MASFDFAAHADLMTVFPFPHQLQVEAEVSDEALTIATTVRASGDVPVPIAFGYHPYLRLPGVDRSAWLVEIPVSERSRSTTRSFQPASRSRRTWAGPLGARTFDDVFAAPAEPFALAGGGRRIEVSFDRGYPYAQVYAPDDDDVIAFEPMTAPTNALVSGQDLKLLEPARAMRPRSRSRCRTLMAERKGRRSRRTSSVSSSSGSRTGAVGRR